MNGVTKITTEQDIMLFSFTDADPETMTEVLGHLADAGVVVDMISQTVPYGGRIRFSFTAAGSFFDTALKALGETGAGKSAAPMISAGYSKINLYGQEMVESVGVAARALRALSQEKLEIAMITTSDLDISLLVRNEDEDVAVSLLEKAYSL